MNEVVEHGVRRRGEAEGEGLLPRELRGEPPREAAGVPAALAGLPLSPLLLAERHLEEGLHAAVSVGEKTGIDAVVHNLKESMIPACLAHLSRYFGGSGRIT